MDVCVYCFAIVGRGGMRRVQSIASNLAFCVLLDARNTGCVYNWYFDVDQKTPRVGVPLAMLVNANKKTLFCVRVFTRIRTFSNRERTVAVFGRRAGLALINKSGFRSSHGFRSSSGLRTDSKG